uniref:Uncharacterized protein n=1 Tax=Strombidinopsis acuminata TaxID=141414 RepID=A0A7S3SFH0_9SPIT|mmetsp:Transcript_30691/g.41668  ORF Transcript_30691/g.41668 Transcript_30691/m.41668 type:complete len:144 (+) Transcript_30691:163-594(+)
MKQFADEHEAATGEKVAPAGGQPDYGSGYFGNKLTYEQWYNFTLRVRAGENYIESCFIVVFMICVGGIWCPWIVVPVGALYWVSRFIYTNGYMGSPQGRVAGAIMGFLCLFIIIICAAVSISELIKGLYGNAIDIDAATTQDL